MIRTALSVDAAGIAEIYNWYIQNTTVTFEEEPLVPAVMQQRMERAGRQYPWIVMEQDGNLTGFAYAAEFRKRSAYRYSVETTIYLAREQQGRGLGTRLYRELIARLEGSSAHALVAVIALPNERSIALHEKLGYRKAGQLQQVGRKFNQWIDVGYWQLTLADKD